MDVNFKNTVEMSRENRLNLNYNKTNDMLLGAVDINGTIQLIYWWCQYYNSYFCFWTAKLTRRIQLEVQKSCWFAYVPRSLLNFVF